MGSQIQATAIKISSSSRFGFPLRADLAAFSSVCPPYHPIIQARQPRRYRITKNLGIVSGITNLQIGYLRTPPELRQSGDWRSRSRAAGWQMRKDSGGSLRNDVALRPRNRSRLPGRLKTCRSGNRRRLIVRYFRRRYAPARVKPARTNSTSVPGSGTAAATEASSGVPPMLRVSATMEVAVSVAPVAT